MVKITAKEEKFGCILTSEGGGDYTPFFAAAINVFDSMNPSCDSASIAIEFLIALVNYIVDKESDWVAGDSEGRDMQGKSIAIAIASLEVLSSCYRVERAIQKAKAFIEASNNPTDPQTP